MQIKISAKRVAKAVYLYELDTEKEPFSPACMVMIERAEQTDEMLLLSACEYTTLFDYFEDKV